MVWVPGGPVRLGSDDGYPDERVRAEVRVDGFWMDAFEVTNAQFQEFVDATGYVTVAEQDPDPTLYPGIPAELLKPGAAVFQPPQKIMTMNEGEWWTFVDGANWRAPKGPGSTIEGRAQYPVVQIAHADALAYAKWKGHELPNEAEWEYAARVANSDTRYAWGEELTPGGKHLANTWQGIFPVLNSEEDGYSRAAPVGCFPPNDKGLYDMIGNVWEWSSDVYSPDRSVTAKHAMPEQRTEEVRHVIKGGSYLCAPDYCLRYRPAARHPQEASLGTNHIGFRTIKRGSAP